MGSGFLFKGGEAFAEELVLVVEGLDLVTKGKRGEKSSPGPD